MQKLQHSKKFLENINMYKLMHTEGYKKKDGGYIDKEVSFNGISTIPYAPIIKIRQNLKIICNCTIVKDGKLKVFPLEFNDKIKNYI